MVQICGNIGKLCIENGWELVSVVDGQADWIIIMPYVKHPLEGYKLVREQYTKSDIIKMTI